MARDALISPRVRSSVILSPRYSRSAARESLANYHDRVGIHDRTLLADRSDRALLTHDRALLYNGSMSWETALADVLSVLRIQYRSEAGLESFLNDPEKVSQLRNSSIARMEYNRRCMREEVDSGIYSPPRARRIAKDVAVDYIRRFQNEEEDRVEMIRKIDYVAKERDEAITTNLEVEGENAELRRNKDQLLAEKDQLICTKTNIEENLSKTIHELKETEETVESLTDLKKHNQLEISNFMMKMENSEHENSQLRADIAELKDDLAGLKNDYEKSRDDNCELRSDYQKVCNESASRRDEISELKQMLEKEKHALARAESHSDSVDKSNKKLQSENSEFKEKNLNLRDQCNVYRAREKEMETLVSCQMKVLNEKFERKELNKIEQTKITIVEESAEESSD